MRDGSRPGGRLNAFAAGLMLAVIIAPTPAALVRPAWVTATMVVACAANVLLSVAACLREDA